jgi:hypothetical protein
MHLGAHPLAKRACAKSEKQVTIQRTDKKSKQTAFVQKYYNLVHYLTIHM